MTTYDLADAYVFTGEIPPPESYRVGVDYAYPQATVYSSHPDDTLTGALSMTGVIRAIEKAPQSHAKGRGDRPAIPVWTLAIIMLGVVLMAIGFLLNESIAWAIYRMIHGG